MTPTLNWKEMTALADKIRPEIQGLFVDRIIIPERNQFPNAYIKGEWAIRLTGRKSEGLLFFSIRPRHPYLTFLKGKGPKASTRATHSPFDLNLSKHLKGARLLDIEALPQERIVILWFTAMGSSDTQKLGLVLFMIPAVPEAFLISTRSNEWPILARSRTVREPAKTETHFKLPTGSKAPDNLGVRTELVATSESFYKIIEKELSKEAFEQRWQIAEKALKAIQKQAKDRFRQSETAYKEAEKEENWQKWGDLLKAHLGNPPPLIGKFRRVSSYTEESDAEIQIDIPCDPKLTVQEQVEKFYTHAKRKQRRIAEGRARAARFKETVEILEKHLAHPPTAGDWSALEKLERASNTRVLDQAPTGKPSKKSGAQWLGKSFNSVDGMPIWVGRDKDENLELTFKCARGNDLWMHIRGKPGAHVLIPLPSGKSAPLETLLDAAHLCIHYSGGAGWGKTEVDYTFKKYVKRIKDSTEASYTNNKTLLINPDRVRIKKLLDQIGGN